MSDCPRPSIIGEVAEIFGRYQAGAPRSQQVHIGPSEVGHTCELHLAYRLAGIPEVKARILQWAALLGTWGHKGAEKAMRKENERLGRERYLVERRAYIEHELVPSGSTDVFDTDFAEVIDWKFVGESTMDKVRGKAAPRLYEVQGHLYGLGWSRMGLAVKSVRIIFLPRWSNNLVRDGYEWVAQYDECLALDALARLATIKAKATLAAGGLLPWSEIPRDTEACRFCPWHDAGRTVAEPDELGCHGWSQVRADLAQLGGIEVRTTAPLDAITVAIRSAQSLAELERVWHDASGHGRWTQEHTNEAKRRKVMLAASK